MPRINSKSFELSATRTTPYKSSRLSDAASSSSSSPSSPSSSNSDSRNATGRTQPSSTKDVTEQPKKKYVCATCERPFTTSGHLARHTRIHTGEKNHKCPFPGCETRCSRQDNLQQHYRIHLSPGSRRSSRSKAGSTTSKRRKTSSIERLAFAPISPPMTPPAGGNEVALPEASINEAPARIYHQSMTPPDSPPPLAQATLPATTQILSPASRDQTSLSPLSQQPLSLNYSYASPAATYPTRSHMGQYMSTPPASVCHTPVNGISTGYSSYMGHSLTDSAFRSFSRDVSPDNFPSRRSSLASVSSFGYSSSSSFDSPSPMMSPIMHYSEPSTPSHFSYSAYGMGLDTGLQLPPQPLLRSNAYDISAPRFETSAVNIAPYQDRYIRSHTSESYIHQPTPTSLFPQWGLTETEWRTDQVQRSFNMV